MNSISSNIDVHKEATRLVALVEADNTWQVGETIEFVLEGLHPLEQEAILREYFKLAPEDQAYRAKTWAKDIAIDKLAFAFRVLAASDNYMAEPEKP